MNKKKRCVKIRNWYNRNFLLIEFIISFCLTLIVIAIIEWNFGFSSIDSWLNGSRSQLYSTLASITGALLGFIITAVSIAIAFIQSEKFDLMKKSPHYPTLYKVFFMAIKFLGLATAINLIALVFDKDTNPVRIITYFVCWGLILSVISLFRCMWVLENLVKIATKKVN